MNRNELCVILNGKEYVVFGASDDLMEFRGAIDDETDCYNGGIIRYNRHRRYRLHRQDASSSGLKEIAFGKELEKEGKVKLCCVATMFTIRKILA